MENFIQAKLRIITLEEHLRKPQELFSPLEVKAWLYKFFETEGCMLNDILLTVYKIQICNTKWWIIIVREQDTMGPSWNRLLPHILCCSSSLTYLDNSI